MSNVVAVENEIDENPAAEAEAEAEVIQPPVTEAPDGTDADDDS